MQTGSLTISETVHIQFSFTAPIYQEDQSISVGAFVDPENTINESNESNNSLYSTIIIKAQRPDVGIVSSNATNWYAGKDVFSIPLFLLCLLCWQKGAMGGGDVKIISVICLYLGLWQTAQAFTVTIAVMFLWYGLVRIAYGRGEMHIRIPLAPPLALGSIAVLAINAFIC